MPQESEVVSFRLHKDLIRLMDGEREVFGISRGDLARGILTAHLLNKEKAEILIPLAEESHRKLDSVEVELSKVQRNIARAVFILLTADRPMASADAKAIVQTKLVK